MPVLTDPNGWVLHSGDAAYALGPVDGILAHRWFGARLPHLTDYPVATRLGAGSFEHPLQHLTQEVPTGEAGVCDERMLDATDPEGRLRGLVLRVTGAEVADNVLTVTLAQGTEQEQAAVTLGADGWQVFTRVTLPNIKWALVYGAVLCTARAVGEFGAVSVVSGNIRGQTNTLPLHVELLFNDLNAVGAFAAASTLTLIAIGALLVKALLENGRAD